MEQDNVYEVKQKLIYPKYNKGSFDFCLLTLSFIRTFNPATQLLLDMKASYLVGFEHDMGIAGEHHRDYPRRFKQNPFPVDISCMK